MPNVLRLVSMAVNRNGTSGWVGTAGSAGSNGFSIAAEALAALGIRHMYGVIGIPVTELASAAQVSF